jgi:pyruvate,water dikinase
LDESRVDEIDRASSEIRTRIEAGTISEPLEDVIAEQYRSLAKRARTPAAPVAVRSSATAEDLPDASFAGQQDTYLWVRGVDDLLDKIRKCWSSLFISTHPFIQDEDGFDHSKVLISVAVQKMVRSFAAGVMFT